MADREISTNPDLLDGGLGDWHVNSENDKTRHDHRTIAEQNVERAYEYSADTPPEKLEELDDGGVAAGNAAAFDISEDGNIERRKLVGMSTIEPGGAISMTADGRRGKYKKGIKWVDGRMVACRTIEHPDFIKSVQRQNEGVRRAKMFAAADHRLFGGPRKAYDQDGTPLTPDKGAPDFLAVKPPATDVIVKSNSRLSRQTRASGREQLQRQTKLDVIRNSIRSRLGDPPTPQRDTDVGAQLEAAKALLERGQFDSWLDSIPLARRTAFAYLEKCKLSLPDKSKT